MTFNDGICDNCERRKVIRNKIGMEFHVCDQSCGRHPANGGHPLSPCVQHGCDDGQEEPECYTDEWAIMEGHRCMEYCAWLNFMHDARKKAHNCTYPYCKGCQHIEITDEERGRCGRNDGFTEFRGYEVWNKTEEEHLAESRKLIEDMSTKGVKE